MHTGPPLHAPRRNVSRGPAAEGPRPAHALRPDGDPGAAPPDRGVPDPGEPDGAREQGRTRRPRRRLRPHGRRDPELRARCRHLRAQLHRRRPAGAHALHGGAPRGHLERDAGRHRQRDGRLDAELRQPASAADGPARPAPEPHRQRLRRDRRGHGDEYPAAQPARDRRRDEAPHRRPRPDDGRPLRDRDRPRFPGRGRHLSLRGAAECRDRGCRARRRHPPRVRAGPRPRDRAREGPQRTAPGQSRCDHRHRAALRGEQGVADRKDRGAGPGQAPRRHLRHPRRERPRGHAGGHRGEARRRPDARPEQPVQAHRDAVGVQPQHARARRPASADARAQGDPPAPHRPSAGGHPPSHRARSRQGERARAHPRGPQDRARPHRRDHQAHPRAQGTGAAPRRKAPRGLWLLRGSGEGDPRDAAPPALRPRAREAGR